MKRTLFVFLLSISVLSLRAQNLDSLYSVWQDETKPDTIRVNAYNTYIWNGYLYSRPDTAEVLAEALHAYAKTQQYPKASVVGYNLQGIANHIQTNYPRSLDYFEKGMVIMEEIGDIKGIAGALHNIAQIHLLQANYSHALEYLEKARVMNVKQGNNKWLANNLTAIGSIYKIQSNYPRALEYNEKSLVIYEEIGDKRGIAIALGAIGQIYNAQGNYPRALENHEKSLAIDEEIGNKYGIETTLQNIGNVYEDQADYPLALKYYKKSLALAEEIGNVESQAICLKNIGMVHQKQGKNSLALDYCQKSLALAEEIGVLTTQKVACECLYNSYKSMGKGNEALVYLEQMNVITDSLNAEETAKKLEQMEFAKLMLQDSIANAEEARLVQEAHQAEVRKKNQTRNMFAGGGIIVLILAGGIYNRLRYTRKSKAVLQVEKDRSDNLLLNILPAEIAEELKQKGRADARDYDNVSILFSDFKGFTEQSAKLSAEELVNEINHCFEAFDGIMEKYGIEKIKTIGDAYMAAGGLPVHSDSAAKNTVLAALDMQAFISARKAANNALGKPAFEMRVGIHSGPIVAGIVGVKKFQYDVWGDTVNTANRMESAGEIGKVNISQATYELLKEDTYFTFERRGKIEAKGKGEMEMFFVSMA